jgi:hypothetical protein
VNTNVTLVSGTKASVIVGFTYDENWNPIFIECILDFQNGVVEVDLVDAATRVAVAKRVFPLTVGTTYPLSAELGIADDGTGYVIFTVQGVGQLEVDSLSSLYLNGMHGFGLYGSLATNSATFADVSKQSTISSGVLTTVDDVAAQLNASGPDQNDNYTVYGLTIAQASLQAHTDFANIYVNSLLGSVINSADPRYGTAKQAALDLACMRALVISMGGSMTGAFDYFLGDLRVTRAGPYATAIKNTIDGLQADFVRQLVNLSPAAAAANMTMAGQVPTYRGGLISP